MDKVRSASARRGNSLLDHLAEDRLRPAPAPAQQNDVGAPQVELLGHGHSEAAAAAGDHHHLNCGMHSVTTISMLTPVRQGLHI